MADLPPHKWQFEIHTDRFLLWELRQIKWQIYPPANGNLRFILIDSYSDSSGTPGSRSTGRCNPHKWHFEMHTDRFLLWELRQIKWQIYPPANGNLRFILTDSYSDSSGTPDSRSTGRCNPHKWQFEMHTDRFLLWELRQIKWQIYPPANGNLRFILIDSCSESSGRSGSRSAGRSTDSYSEGWDRSGGRLTGRSTPLDLPFDRFLPWQFRQTRWQINWQMYRFPLWGLRQTRWQINW